MKFFLAVACLAVAVAAEAGTDSLLWENFKLTHNKVYDSKVEEVQRFNIFQQNLRKIEDHNAKFEAGEVSWFMGVNHFADLTKEEFSSMLQTQGRNPSYNSTLPRTTFVKSGIAVPASVDWREKNAVTEVKDQGYCGGCWAFSVTGALEGAYALKHNKLVSFSEQQLIDCTGERTKYGLAGCNGGQLDPAFEYMKDYGMESESDYPFEERDGSCRYSASKVVSGSKITGYVDVPVGDEDALVEAVSLSPVSIAINGDDIQMYSGGVFDDARCARMQVDHGVLVVGYTAQYWIVKNSWGPSWGQKGYILFQRGKNICQITSEPSYPKL